MAITRTQIAKQLLANGGRIGFRVGTGEGKDTSGRDYGGGVGRSDRDSQYGGGSYDSSQNVSGRGKTNFTGRDPTVSLTEDPVTTAQKARELIALGNRKIGFGTKINFPNFLPTIKKGLDLIKVPQGTFMDQARIDFSRALDPRTVAGGGGGDEQGPVPYWAQLGFNSEAEYLASLAAQASGTTEQETEVEEPFQLSRRFRAEGGIMNSDVVGGEYDFESARQMYGLGKLVKKVTRTVKKIAKSPIGKAAIAAATIKFGGQGLARIFPTTFGSTAKSPFLRAIGRGQFFGDTGIFSAGKTALFGPSAIGPNVPEGILSKIGPFGAIAGASALAGLLTPEQEEEAQELARGEGIDLEAARRSILNAGTAQDFRARRFRAEGGSMKEPVAKKTMPLLDMGGKEMDLREDGGFVPIGRMEKADDVPARLSKNEFVFTADAVRNAGDGDVDKGAEVMYNMMKNLESGGDVSEESQGLEGARKMFQTSQRLEEVL
jgi:hypothetical protein